MRSPRVRVRVRVRVRARVRVRVRVGVRVRAPRAEQDVLRRGEHRRAPMAPMAAEQAERLVDGELGGQHVEACGGQAMVDRPWCTTRYAARTPRPRLARVRRGGRTVVTHSGPRPAAPARRRGVLSPEGACLLVQ